MRSVLWVLRPSLPADRGREIVEELAARKLNATLRESDGRTVVVIDEPPAGLEAPPEVERAAHVDTPTAGSITRRTFVDAFAAALAVAAAGAGVGVAAAFATPVGTREEDVVEMEATSLTELKARGSVRFRFGREPAIVVLEKGHVVALSLVCTHLGCLVEWRPDESRFVCPCHRAAFNIDGGVLEGPPPRPLATFETSVKGDRVFVRRRA